MERLRPALSARVLSEQLKKTEQVCAEIAGQVRRLDLQNGRLLEQLSKLHPSITLDRLENKARLKVPLHQLFLGSADAAPLRTELSISGRLLPGVRNPEGVLVRWAESLRAEGVEARIWRLAPSTEDTGTWLFEIRLKGD